MRRKTARACQKKAEQGWEGIRDDPYLLLADEDVDTVPPAHVGGLGEQVVAAPAGDGDDGHGLEDKVLLPADAGKHMDHLVLDLIVAGLAVLGDIAVLFFGENGERDWEGSVAAVDGVGVPWGDVVE